MSRPSSGHFSSSATPPRSSATTQPTRLSLPLVSADASFLNGVSSGPAGREPQVTADQDGWKEVRRQEHRSSRNGSGRHRPRTSGGFLLDSSVPRGPPPQALPRHRVSSRDTARHNRDGALTTTSQVPPHKRQLSTNGTGARSSPLAIQITSAGAAASDADGGSKLVSQDESGHLVPPKRPTGGGLRLVDGADEASRPGSRAAPAVVDADPAQIVNLALSLSESRRRTSNISSTSTIRDSNNRRSVSAALRDESANPAAGSLRQYLQQQRRASWNPPTAKPKRPHAAQVSEMAHIQPDSGDASPTQSLSAPLAIIAQGSPGCTFSEATLARAEMAKTRLELSAEYRRLLQMLPPLLPRSDAETSTPPGSPRFSDARRPLSRRVSTSSKAVADDVIGRRYNPLQGIRDRKTRARAKMTIDTDGEGWSDVSKVRTWVDQVKQVSSQPSFRAVDRVNLPPFIYPTHDVAEGQKGAVDATPSPGTPNTKQKRLRNDWLVSPAELLADAYWLEQEGHKSLIEDQHGRCIFPTPGRHQAASPRSSHDEPASGAPRSPGGPPDHDASPRRSVESRPIDMARPTERPSDTKAPHERSDALKREKPKEHNVDATFLPRLGRRKGVSSHSPSSSNSSVSYEGAHVRGRRGRRRAEPMKSAEAIDTALLEIRMNKILEQEARKSGLDASDERAHGSPEPRTITSGASAMRARPRPVTARSAVGPQHHRSDSLESSDRAHTAFHRASASLDRGHHFRLSIDGIDTTAPNSPLLNGSSYVSKIASGFVPSIAIDLSPPVSRNQSPARRLVGAYGVPKLGHPRLDRSRERDTLSQVSLATKTGDQLSRATTNNGEEMSDTGIARRRTSSPVGKKVKKARRTSENVAPDDDCSGVRRRRTDKQPEKEGDASRLRSFFRAGRLQNIKSEVSKVGDFFWKQDNRPTTTALSSPASSVRTEASDSREGGELSELNRPTTGKGPRAGLNESADASTRVNDGEPPPRFHIDNLPTFTSSSPRERAGLSKSASPEADPKLPQQLARRGEPQNPRANHLAPLRGQANSASPAQSPGLSLIETRDFDTRPGNERRPTDTGRRPSDTSLLSRAGGVTEADARLKEVLGFPGRAGAKGALPVTGLSALDALARRKSGERPGVSLTRQWSISDRGVTVSQAAATRQEIARVRALLLSSGVKAQEITRRAAAVEEIPAALLERKPGLDVPHVPRSQHYTHAARIHLHDIDSASLSYEDTAKRFVDETVVDLHAQIDSSKDQVSNQISPMVQTAADDADALITELATTHTLAIKQLNDSLTTMLRRRRRRLRWIRRSGYVLLEWTLLGAMWWVWLVVVVIRLVRGVVRGGAGGVKWLLFL